MHAATFRILLSSLCVGLATTCGLGQSPGESPSGVPTGYGQPDPASFRTFVELARADVRTTKAVIIAENLPLSSDEASEFWPLQREYEFELNKLLDQRLALIQKFLPAAGAMSDAQAKELAKAAFDIEDRRTALKRTYFTKFCTVIPAAKAARFFQLENQINSAIELKIAAQVPLIK